MQTIGISMYSTTSHQAQTTRRLARNCAALVILSLLASSCSMFSWGRNASGQLGDGTTTETLTPVAAPGDDWYSSSNGWGIHRCALKDDLTAWCWGSGNGGALGQSSSSDSLVPVQVGTDSDWLEITNGWLFSCGVQLDGTLWCWGDNQLGKTGLGVSTGDTLVATQIGTDTNWNHVSSGYSHSCATKTDGTMYCWGATGFGQLGIGLGFGSASTPQLVNGTGWAKVYAGYFSTCGIKTDGTGWCWGYNGNGELGLGSTASEVTSPAQIGSDTDWFMFGGGNFHNCGIKGTPKQTYCWGYNGGGAIGDGTSVNSNTPVYVSNDYTWISAGTSMTCGIATDATLDCWGELYLPSGASWSSTTPEQQGTNSDFIVVYAGDNATMSIRNLP